MEGKAGGRLRQIRPRVIAQSSRICFIQDGGRSRIRTVDPLREEWAIMLGSVRTERDKLARFLRLGRFRFPYISAHP